MVQNRRQVEFRGPQFCLFCTWPWVANATSAVSGVLTGPPLWGGCQGCSPTVPWLVGTSFCESVFGRGLFQRAWQVLHKVLKKWALPVIKCLLNCSSLMGSRNRRGEERIAG